MRCTLCLAKVEAIIHAEDHVGDRDRITSLGASTPDLQVVRASGDLALAQLLALIALITLRALVIQPEYVGPYPEMSRAPNGWRHLEH
jgi:hypothetical protein